jgi:DNA-binding GntR family transcriptional regulator
VPLAGKAPLPAKRTADTVARLHERLHRMMIRFEIPPGERINEVELAGRLKVSRTPLREALNRLAMDGLLTIEPNRGFRCRPLDTKEMIDLYEAREVVELGALRLAVDRASDEAIAALERFWAEVATRAEGPATELLRGDEAFHERLAALSDNGELVRALKSINARIHFVRWMDLEREERRARTYNEHGQLIAALKARDEAGALRILAAHIERRRDQIAEVIKAGVVRLFYR